MAQNRQQRRLKQNGDRMAPKVEPLGAAASLTPSTNRGGKGETDSAVSSAQSGTDRTRVNVSLPPAVYAGLAASAERLGTSVSQMAAAAIMAGLPLLADQVEAVNRLG